jgi:DNA-directed RNA polymerase subunit RPC12/RpoP
LSKLVPVRCPHCGGRSYLGTDSTFFRKMLAKYHYRCRSCGRAEEMNFDHPVQ